MVTFNKHVVTWEFPWGQSHPDTKDTRYTRQSGTPLSSLSPPVALHAYLMCHQDQNLVHLHMKNPLSLVVVMIVWHHKPTIEWVHLWLKISQWRQRRSWDDVMQGVLMDCRCYWSDCSDAAETHTLQERESTPNSVKLFELTSKLHFLPLLLK